MGKLIVKTALRTLLVAFMLFVVAFAVLTFAAPKVIADMSFQLNIKSLCVRYDVLQYNKSGKISDLDTLVERSIWASANEETIVYGTKLLASSEFDDYAAYADSLRLDNVTGDYENYITGSVAVALYSTGNRAGAVSLVVSLNSVSYPENNAVQALAYTIYENSDKDAAEYLLSSLSNLGNGFSEAEKTALELDRQFLQSIK